MLTGGAWSANKTTVGIPIMDTTNQWFTYLHSKRKLSVSVIHEAMLTEYKGRLRIPVFDVDGKLLFSKYRAAPWEDSNQPKYIYEKGASAALYGVNFEVLPTALVYTEGEMDALALRTLGFNAVSTTGGALTFRNEWANHLPDKVKIICYDNDETGIKGAVKVALTLNTCVYTWVPPVHGKDVSDLLMKNDPLDAARIFSDTSRMIHLNIPTDRAGRKRYIKELSEKAKAMDISVGKKFLFELITTLNAYNKTEVKKKWAHDPEMNSDKERAKAYPIDRLITVRGDRKAICPFHNEKTPSLHVYKDNTAFCYGGCQRAYDSIDIYMHQHSCDFKTAVEELGKL